MTQLVLTIQRPDGTIERVTRPYLPPQLRSKATQDTRSAGRGEIIGWDYIDDQPIAMTPADTARAQVTKLFVTAERLIDEPGRYFPALRLAQEAKARWQADYPAEAKAEQQERVAEEAAEAERRERDYRSSFIGRGLD